MGERVCRLMAMLAPKGGSMHDAVYSGEYSMLRQAKLEGHNDGWGFCGYRNGLLDTAARSTMAFADSSAYAECVISGRYGAALFFIRDASNPRGIDMSRLITVDATQPFSYGNLSFMHNGAVMAPDEVVGAVGDAGIRPRSLNDSEAYFVAFHKFLGETNDFGRALRMAEGLIVDVAKKAGKERPFGSLNAVICDGERLYAYNRYLNKVRKSLMKDSDGADREFYMMCFRDDADSIVVASEPVGGGYTDIGDGRLLEAWVGGDGAVRHSVYALND